MGITVAGSVLGGPVVPCIEIQQPPDNVTYLLACEAVERAIEEPNTQNHARRKHGVTTIESILEAAADRLATATTCPPEELDEIVVREYSDNIEICLQPNQNYPLLRNVNLLELFALTIATVPGQEQRALIDEITDQYGTEVCMVVCELCRQCCHKVLDGERDDVIARIIKGGMNGDGGFFPDPGKYLEALKTDEATAALITNRHEVPLSTGSRIILRLFGNGGTLLTTAYPDDRRLAVAPGRTVDEIKTFIAVHGYQLHKPEDIEQLTVQEAIKYMENYNKAMRTLALAFDESSPPHCWAHLIADKLLPMIDSPRCQSVDKPLTEYMDLTQFP